MKQRHIHLAAMEHSFELNMQVGVLLLSLLLLVSPSYKKRNCSMKPGLIKLKEKDGSHRMLKQMI
jgi:hypothetical protein